VIKKVQINMCPILDGYGIMGIFNCLTRPRVNRVLWNQLAGVVHSLSGSLCFGRRWHFRNPALSRDQFKLKVISRSYLYIYTLNVSCIMLFYFFVPFVVSNRYLLF